MSLRWTEEQLAEYTRMAKNLAPAKVAKEPKRKYGNKKVKTDEGTFDSKGEWSRWQQLKMMERAGAISDKRRAATFLDLDRAIFAKETPIMPDQSPAYCASEGCLCSEIVNCTGACL